ncbi:MAG: FGGY-family carbohydrate kinase, partial [Pseudomonadota bacterium]|nr:FGGY-family carbohydrate kinase [Pseudomonadota bacterium]
EGVAWLVSDMLDSMSQTSDIKFDHVRVDGGASVNNMLMQLQANFLQTRIHRSKNKEITALGASLLAKLGMGIYESREDIKKSLPSNDLFEPNINQSNRDKQHAVWARAIERSSAWTDN